VATRTTWADVYDELHDRQLSELPPEQLEALADAAWWTSHVDEAIRVRQKAYAAYAAAGHGRRAAYSAWFLFWDHVFRGEDAVANGWLRRAERHLASEPECVEHGFVAFARGELALWRREIDEARVAAEHVIDLGQRLGSADLVALGIECRGRVGIAEGRISEGRSDLDEAMCSVIAGELSPLFTGWIYCHVLVACWDLADLGRAGEWTDAALRWCEDLPSAEAPFSGLCRIHRVEIAILRGAWATADAEARRTCDELLNYEPHCAGMAFNAAGEVRRRMGDLRGAEAAFARAHELGYDPQPGLALVQQARGQTEAAAAALRLAVADGSRAGLPRAQLLAAQVDVALAAGDPEAASSAAAELETLAERVDAPALRAAAARAAGAIRLAEGDAAGSVPSLRSAVTTWQNLGAPYEAAMARVLIAEAARKAGDEEGARLELGVACSVFRRLGASADEKRARRLLDATKLDHGGLTPRELEVLRLVAQGNTNKEIAAELVISEHTAARHLNNIFAKLRVTTRAAATAFAYTHDLVD
jgi:DNA-binding CsgD family transcriptional regulator